MESKIDDNSFKKLIKTITTDVVETASIYQLMLKKNRVRGDPDYSVIPVSLFPTPYPLDLYKEAYNLQRPFGDLVASTAANPKQNLYQPLHDIAEQNEFVKRLIGISQALQEQRERGEPVQAIQCLVLRVDFMIDNPTHQLKLVEYNTIATGFVNLGNKVANLHRYVLEKYGDVLPMNYPPDYHAISGDAELRDLPFHRDASAQFDSFVAKFADVIKLYKESLGLDPSSDVWVLFVADPNERNMCDQKAIEVMLQHRFGVHSIRKTHEELFVEAQVDQQSKRLVVDGREIGFVYFRCGFSEDHYKVADGSAQDEARWEARLKLESSVAIKCPSIDFHLAGFKKLQQSYSDETFLRKCAGSETTADSLKDFFKGIWSLEDCGKTDAAVNSIVEQAIARPEKYVLKPQKEGGGNNFFDDQVRDKLERFLAGQEPELTTYLIMERIMPPEISSLFLVNGVVTPMMSLSEFGYYSFVLSSAGQGTSQVISNDVLGSLMRSKGSHLGEGGVSAGSGVIDSPLVIESEIFKNNQGIVKGTVQLPNFANKD